MLVSISSAVLMTAFTTLKKLASRHTIRPSFVLLAVTQVPWMPEVFSLLERWNSESRSGEKNLWYRQSSSLRRPVQWDAVSYSQSQILTLAIRLVPGTCQF